MSGIWYRRSLGHGRQTQESGVLFTLPPSERRRPAATIPILEEIENDKHPLGAAISKIPQQFAFHTNEETRWITTVEVECRLPLRQRNLAFPASILKQLSLIRLGEPGTSSVLIGCERDPRLGDPELTPKRIAGKEMCVFLGTNARGPELLSTHSTRSRNLNYPLWRKAILGNWWRGRGCVKLRIRLLGVFRTTWSPTF
jgi:hypothetical protein